MALISVHDAKSWLRVPDDKDDVDIAGLIEAAQNLIFDHTGLYSPPQNYYYPLPDTWCGGDFVLPYGHVSLTSIAYHGEDGLLETVSDLASWVVRGIRAGKWEHSCNIQVPGEWYGNLAVTPRRLRPDFTLAYKSGIPDSSVPALWRQTCKHIVAEMYANRGAGGNVSGVFLERMLKPLRRRAVRV